MIRYIWKFYSVFVVVYDDRAFVENTVAVENVCSVSWKYLLSVLHVQWGCYV